MAERTVTISGLGKTYSVTGWWVGWAIAPPHLTETIRKFHNLLVISASAPLQGATVVALELPDRYYTDLLGFYARKRARIMEILAQAAFAAAPLEGTSCVLADFAPLNFPSDDYAFAHYLTTEIGVAVMPGSSFCHDPIPYAHTVRLAFPRRDETLEEVAYRLKALRR
jgi:aminotransferase